MSHVFYRHLHQDYPVAVRGEGIRIVEMGGTIDGRRGDHLLLAPPFIVTEGELGTIIDRLAEAVDAAIAQVLRHAA